MMMGVINWLLLLCADWDWYWICCCCRGGVATFFVHWVPIGWEERFSSDAW